MKERLFNVGVLHSYLEELQLAIGDVIIELTHIIDVVSSAPKHLQRKNPEGQVIYGIKYNKRTDNYTITTQYMEYEVSKGATFRTKTVHQEKPLVINSFTCPMPRKMPSSLKTKKRHANGDKDIQQFWAVRLISVSESTLPDGTGIKVIVDSEYSDELGPGGFQKRSVTHQIYTNMHWLPVCTVTVNIVHNEPVVGYTWSAGGIIYNDRSNEFHAAIANREVHTAAAKLLEPYFAEGN